MKYVYLLLLAILLLLFYMYLEARWVQVKRVNFTKSRKGLKILHISDIHIDMLRIPANKVRKIIKAENPDFIIISGDYIQRPIDASDFLEYIQAIRQGYQIYLCLGNHDYRAYADNPAGLDTFIREMEKLQLTVMRNSSVQIEKNSFKYNLIGIDDLGEGSPDIEKAVKDCHPGAVNIAFTHNPDLALQLSRKNADYLFCGHFHGGQIWMPFNLEFILLRKDILCKKGVRRGLHKINGINVYLNRGLGTTVIPLRFLSRPEITVYTIS